MLTPIEKAALVLKNIGSEHMGEILSFLKKDDAARLIEVTKALDAHPPEVQREVLSELLRKNAIMKVSAATERANRYLESAEEEDSGIDVTSVIERADHKQLLELIKNVSGSCIYHHTHRFLQQHQYLSPEPPNDFAYWVVEVLSEDELGEKLASIDTVQFLTIHDLREEIITVIEEHLENSSLSKLKFASEGEEFVFIRAVSFVAWTDHFANDLAEFAQVLKTITVDSIYFHIFESRLRLGKQTNDFSNWLESSLGESALAKKIASLDPYTLTLDELRSQIIRAIEKRILKG